MTTSYEDLLLWALTIRRRTPCTVRLASLLTRAVTPELAARSLADDTVSAKLAPLPAPHRVGALTALGVIATHTHLRHSAHVPLGRALSTLRGDTAATTLAATIGLSQGPALRIIGNALGQAGKHGPVNLAEFVALAAEWEDLTPQRRARFLVDFHATDRA